MLRTMRVTGVLFSQRPIFFRPSPIPPTAPTGARHNQQVSMVTPTLHSRTPLLIHRRLDLSHRLHQKVRNRVNAAMTLRTSRRCVRCVKLFFCRHVQRHSKCQPYRQYLLRRPCLLRLEWSPSAAQRRSYNVRYAIATSHGRRIWSKL